MKSQYAFTLIELLIVVAIIGILALIVLPNFLTAQVRAKVARSQADMKAIENSLMTYRLDNNNLPPMAEKGLAVIMLSPIHVSVLHQLTTPIPYINSGAIFSPFSQYHGYWYYNWSYFPDTTGELTSWYYNNLNHREKTLWMVQTIGPVMTEKPYDTVDGNIIMWQEYNPTNGVSSRGLIQIHGR